jgi:hypothetical protein
MRISQEHQIQFLVLVVGALIIISTNGGFGAERWGYEIWMTAGAAFFGGGLAGLTLLGRATKTSATLEGSRESSFREFRPNHEFGTSYWLDFAAGIRTDSETFWLVGRRNLLWIDPRQPFRKALAEHLRKRMEQFGSGADEKGAVKILVADSDARKQWRDFVSEEVANGPHADAARRLVQIGLMDRTEEPWYSAAAFGREVVVTASFRQGNFAHSPTFSMDPGSEMGELYMSDFKRINEKVLNWWRPGGQTEAS